ncbi:MAG: AMP-binding protein [Pseudomonadales bacterium]
MPPSNNLFEVFRQYFPPQRNKTFLIDGSGHTISYAEMEARSAQIAHYFLSLGLTKGDRVAVQVGKSASALLVYLAAVRAGLIYLPLNTAYRESELRYFFADAQPSLVICDPEDQHPIHNLLNTESVLLDVLTATGSGSLIDKVAAFATEFDSVNVDPDDLAAILYTSGTTGQPKGAMLSHGNLTSNALMLKDYWGWNETDVLLHVLPIFHVHGLFVACHCVLAAGAAMIFLPGFNVDEVKAQLPNATVMMGVPTYYTRLLAQADIAVDDCRSMRLFISGSAPLLETTHRQFEQRTGHRILERYGMSETSMLVSNPLNGDRRVGTVGLPLPGVEVRIVDADNVPVAVDVVGSIQVKGPNVFQGYWQMPEKTAAEFTADGFFITGDQGTVSAEGYIAIVGRSNDMIITGGYNVYPKEVELVIDDIAGIKESAVFGIINADWGELVTAVVVGDGSKELLSESILEATKQRLANYKVPKVIYFIDELPRNTMGKVQKNSLRKRFSS